MNHQHRPFLAVLFYWNFLCRFTSELASSFKSAAVQVDAPERNTLVVHGHDQLATGQNHCGVAPQRGSGAWQVIKHFIQYHGFKLAHVIGVRIGLREQQVAPPVLSLLDGQGVIVNAKVGATNEREQQPVTAPNIQHTRAVFQNVANDFVTGWLVYVFRAVKEWLGIVCLHRKCGSHARLYAVVAVLAIVHPLMAAQYFVRTDGADTNDGLGNNPDSGGTANQAWLTIGKAESTMVAGDTVNVANGTYDERVACTGVSGSAGSFINYVGNSTGTGVIMRGWSFTDVTYIKVIGFEMTTNAIRSAVRFHGSCSNIMILDNYIHHTKEEVVHVAGGSRATHVTIRGNRIYYVANPGASEAPNTAINCETNGVFWLVENNEIQKSGDFCNLYGGRHIVRNNHMHDANPPDWPAGTTHHDFFQPGSDGIITFARDHVYERNLNGNIQGEDGHFGIWQDVMSNGVNGDTNHLIRGNVGFEIATGGTGNIGTHGMRVYHNTMSRVTTNGGAVFIFNSPGGDPARRSTNGFVGNNIVVDDNVTVNDLLYVDTGHQVVMTNNLGYLAGSHPSYVSTADPQFVNAAGLDFRVNSGSPAINTGTTNIILITSSGGSGTLFTVNDGYMLCDGWGIVEGDVITVNGTTTRVVGITNHTIGVTISVTWSTGDAVIWGSDAVPDIGAIPFGSTLLSGATYTTAGGTATITTTGNARKIWQYRGGVPIAEDYDAPYTFSHTAGDTYKAYPLYAQSAGVTGLLAADAGEAGSAAYRNKGRSTRSAGVIP